VERPGKPEERERVYSDEEVAKLWQAFGQIGQAGRVFKACLVTGQRLREVANMPWLEINGDMWTIPGSRTKNGRTHTVPLSQLAREILEPQRVLGSDYAFPSPVDNGKPVSAFGKARDRVRALSGVADFIPHDLRRTMATGLQRLGVRLEVTEAALNHVSGSRAGIVGVYQRHDWAEEKRLALAGWARHLRGIIEPGGNVVALSTARPA
jgi:integrase